MGEDLRRFDDSVSVEASRACPTVLTAACAAMRVTYVPPLARFEHERARDALEIVIAAGDFVFHASYRPGDGVCSLEHESILASSRGRADVLVIALDRAFFQNSARGALGRDALMPAAHYCAADTLMKELGNVLLRDFRARRIPSPAYLESLAGVIAVHLAAHHYAHKPAPAARGLPVHKLQRALRFIDEHIAGAIFVADLAATAHMSLSISPACSRKRPPFRRMVISLSGVSIVPRVCSERPTCHSSTSQPRRAFRRKAILLASFAS